MSRLIGWFSSEPFRLWGAIAIGALIGLAAAYAREREKAHRVDWLWFINRLLLYPFLGLTTATVAQTAHMSKTMTAFVSATFALLSFDALRIIQNRFARDLDEGAGDLKSLFTGKDDEPKER